MERWPGRYTVFVSLPAGAHAPDLLRWEIPDNAMVEIPAQTLAHPMTQALVKRAARGHVSMRPAWHTPGTKLDGGSRPALHCSPTQQAPAPDADAGPFAGLVRPPIPESFEVAIGRGFAMAAPRMVLHAFEGCRKASRLRTRRSSAHELVRNNADIREIETVIQTQDVVLSYKLLRHINSVGFGLMCEIQSFRHAVSILGYNKLHKWPSVLLSPQVVIPRQRH